MKGFVSSNTPEELGGLERGQTPGMSTLNTAKCSHSEGTMYLNLLWSPRVEVNTLHTRYMYPQVSMDTSTSDAHKYSNIPRGPSWSWYVWRVRGDRNQHSYIYQCDGTKTMLMKESSEVRDTPCAIPLAWQSAQNLFSSCRSMSARIV